MTRWSSTAHVEQPAGGDRLGGQVEIVRARRRVARRVVVDEDDARRVLADRVAEELADADQRRARRCPGRRSRRRSTTFFVLSRTTRSSSRSSRPIWRISRSARSRGARTDQRPLGQSASSRRPSSNAAASRAARAVPTPGMRLQLDARWPWPGRPGRRARPAPRSPGRARTARPSRCPRRGRPAPRSRGRRRPAPRAARAGDPRPGARGSSHPGRCRGAGRGHAVAARGWHAARSTHGPSLRPRRADGAPGPNDGARQFPRRPGPRAQAHRRARPLIAGFSSACRRLPVRAPGFRPPALRRAVRPRPPGRGACRCSPCGRRSRRRCRGAGRPSRGRTRGAG